VDLAYQDWDTLHLRKFRVRSNGRSTTVSKSDAQTVAIDLPRRHSSIGRKIQVLPYSAASPEAHRCSPLGFLKVESLFGGSGAPCYADLVFAMSNT
jgi:hypothetical protein